jgi:hypothetical protein
MKFKPFFLDTNACFGTVQTPADFEQAVKKTAWFHKSTEDDARAHLLGARRCERLMDTEPAPNFGLYREHTGKQTLAEYLEVVQ